MRANPDAEQGHADRNALYQEGDVDATRTSEAIIRKGTGLAHLLSV